MAGVLAVAFQADTRRVWLHTCTNDHPAAPGFYRRMGFRAYKFAIEVMDDPRLTGACPETAGPRIPIIRPA
jgi:ribosomal protein S18 acetylase RimI-like enzyme